MTISDSDFERFKKNTKLLEEALETDPCNAKYVFYLAQRYRETSNLPLALLYYAKRASMAGDKEEGWYAALQVARTQHTLNFPRSEIVNSYLDAWNKRPYRAEPLYDLCFQARIQKEYHLGYIWGLTGISIPLPDKDILFMEHEIYVYKMLDEFSINAYWAGKYKESAKAAQKLLSCAPEVHLSRIRKNLDFALRKLNPSSKKTVFRTKDHKIPATFSILVSTRGRPERLREMWQSALDTADSPKELEFILRCDNDDPSLEEYKRFCKEQDITLIVAPRPSVLSMAWDECLEFAISDIFFLCSDDLIFQTKGWDTAVKQTIERFDDRLIVVGCWDGNYKTNALVHFFITRQWINTIGHMLPPYYESDYGDTWINEVADAINRKILLKEFVIKHRHPRFCKDVQMDQTYIDGRQRAKDFNVRQKYYSPEHKEKRLAEIALLKKLIKN